MSEWMLAALAEATRRRGFCAPNPAVGAVLVKQGELIASGCHWAAGQPHAEVVALQQAGAAAQGADLYVTLEPCSHHGRTPPCTQAIIQSGVKQVFFGYRDPNDTAAGGQAVLQHAGVGCDYLPLPEISAFYQSYIYWLKQQQPWVTAKLALSADGKIAAHNGAPLKITGAACAQLTHQWRRSSDAILTTVKTIIADDPALNVRLDNTVEAKPVYILDRHAQLPPNARILKTAASVTIFHVGHADKARIKALEALSVKCIPVAEMATGLDLTAILKALGKAGVHDLWIEAGGHCFTAFYQQGLLHRALLYHAPITLGEDALDAFTETLDLEGSAKQVSWQTLGQDRVCRMEF